MKKTNPRNKLTAVALSVIMACSAPAAFTAAAEQTPESDAKPDRIEEIIAGMTLREKAGQMIIADFDTWKQVSVDGGAVNVPVTTLPEEVKAAIARNHFGGIILMRTNCPESEQTLRLVNEMQAANLAGDAANPVPLLIATDQEGGIVTRLGEGTRWPDCMALTATGDPANAESAAKHISEELSALGINTDFAPVLDVNNNPANPVIGQRSFGDDPAIVAQYGLSYLNGLQEGGTIASLKHFPGHGDVDTDSHTGFPRLDKTYEELKECELIPFQAAIDAGADIVMTAHIQYPKIETETYTSITTGEKVCLPATLSRRILTGILREDMGFDGVIVSDALNMQAIIDNFALNDVCVMAIEAGIDMFLMPVPATDPESLAKLEAFEDFICEQVEKGVLTEERLEASVRRILTMKAAHGLLDVPKTKMTDEEITAATAIPGSQANRELEWDLMKKAVTLLKNENDLLPLKVKEGEKVLCLYSSDSWLNTAEYSRLRLMEEGLLPEGAAFEAMSFCLENREECLETAKNADYVIGVTTLFGASALDPATKSGAEMAVLDDIIEVVHDAGHPFILMSAYLPYDVARFQAADAIVVTYGSLPMPEMPAGNQTCSPNIPAAMCGIFGGYEFAGQLPINIPKLDENYHFTDEILYARAVRSDTQNMTADGSTESITDPASDDSAEPENGTPSDNTTEPVTDSASDNSAEPVTDPASDDSAEPVTDPASGDSAEPVTDPASGDSAEPVTDPASDDSAEPEGASAASEAEAVLTDVAEALADVSSPLPSQWQAQITFPDWKGYTDDTLAMNSMYTFYGCHGQGAIYVQPAADVTGFKMYVNGTPVDTSQMTGGGTYPVDISALAMDGQNTIQISNIRPFDLAQAVTVTIPYPEVLSGTPAEAGISEQALSMLSDIIEADVENGFPSAQLAIIRGGRLVYENAWGRLNSYLPDGSVNEDSPAVTTQTLYDLASVTKMFSVNYALQKLLTDGAVDLDAKITQFLGDAFVQDTILLSSDDSTGFPDLDTIKDWKAGLTIRDLLRHQGGFAADPGYSRPWFYVKDLAEGGSYPSNPLFAGNGADEATKEATIQMICKTPLQYKPGTKTLYSDVDYMILGLVVEKITGMGLDKWLKETFWDPMGLTRITYNPLENGFTPDDCAATELNGNTRDGILDIEGFRTYTLQGEVHDETAYYSMNGVSGHAGMFASATDLAKLASVMLSGGYGEHRFFSGNVMEQFTAPKKEDAGNWGLGWWRQGDSQRVWYFGTQAESGTIGHQGWTGTLVMIDPERQLVIAFLTNRINSPVTDRQESPDQFDGNWFTTSTVGFVPQILSIGMDTEQDISAQLLDLSADMVVESLKLLPAGKELSGSHPAARNARARLAVFQKLAGEAANKEQAKTLTDEAADKEQTEALTGAPQIKEQAEDLTGAAQIKQQTEALTGAAANREQAEALTREVAAAWDKVRSDHKPNFNDVLIKVIAEIRDGGGYDTGTKKRDGMEQTAWEGLDAAVTITDDGTLIDPDKARPSFDSSACYIALLKALSEWDTDGQISREAWICLKPYTVDGAEWPVQKDGVGCWGRANAKGPGIAALAAQLGAGKNTYLPPRKSFNTEEEYYALWNQLQPGDFLKLSFVNETDEDSASDALDASQMVIFLRRFESHDEEGNRDDVLYYWSSNGSGYMPDKGYGIGKIRMSEIDRAVSTRITYAGAFDRARDLAPDNVDPWLNALTDGHPATEAEWMKAFGR